MTRSKPRYQPDEKIDGRYLVHQVKMGGMSEVYLCLDLEQNYPYALKTFQQRYQSQALRKAFEQEVATWVALEKHPNIVRCFAMDILDYQPFMVLEWIAGEENKGTDLRGWLRHGPLELRTALDFTIDICRGLIHAQEKQPGLVHRDLKPENILVAQGGVAKITDFGLAQIAARAGLNVTGEEIGNSGGRHSLAGQKGIVGTPAYMAPEQWRGEDLDERTDIYALGCVLYEMLTGRWPFQVDFRPTTPQQFQQWLNAMQDEHEIGRLRRMLSACPNALNDLLKSCLAKAQAERPHGLADLLDRLTLFYRQQFDETPPSRPKPGDFTAVDYNNRGLTYANLKQFNQALADYSRAIEINPELAPAYSNRGTTYAHLQRYDEALENFNRAVALDPTYVPAYSNRGIVYSTLQQYDRALEDFNYAIGLDRKLAPAYNNRGTTYYDLKRYDKALDDFDQAIELDPAYASAYSNRGLTHHDLQQYDQALADYARAIEFDPTYAQAYFNRGTTYQKLHQYEAALVDYTQALELDPTYAQAYSNRGLTYADLQQYYQALADYSHAIKIDPNLVPPYFNRGATFAELQRYDEALRDYSRAIELNPNYVQAYSNRGTIYLELQQYRAALADCNRVIELDPTDAPAYYNRGNTYKALQQYDEALGDYSRAIELDSDFAQAYSNRGNTYNALQQYDEAVADYIRALKLNPEDALTYYNLGALFANTGQLRESLPHFEKAVRFGLPQATQTIVHIERMLGVESTPHIDPTQQAFEVFQQAESAEAMYQAVASFPFMTQADVITAIEQAVAQQVPLAQRRYFEQRLVWLRQIAEAQNQ